MPGGVSALHEGIAALNGTGAVCDLISICDVRLTVYFGMAVGSVYEIVVFQAEPAAPHSVLIAVVAEMIGLADACP